jgi:hypothetical protein
MQRRHFGSVVSEPKANGRRKIARDETRHTKNWLDILIFWRVRDALFKNNLY